MEEGRWRKKMKIIAYSPPCPSLNFFDFDLKVFPLMLAATSAAKILIHSSLPLLKCFLHAHITLLATADSALPPCILLPHSLLALLPLFLTSRWEGFVHIALHCWNMKKQACVLPADSESAKLRYASVNMLHVAVRLIADKNSIFKKACLIATLPFLDGEHFLASRLKCTFSYLIGTIGNSPICSESIVTAVGDNNEDYLQWMRWLRHLPQEEDEKGKLQ